MHSHWVREIFPVFPGTVGFISPFASAPVKANIEGGSDGSRIFAFLGPLESPREAFPGLYKMLEGFIERATIFIS